MKIVGKKILNDFKQRHADVRSSIDAWEAEVAVASWSKPSEIKQRYPKASFLARNHVVFDLRGNKYRLLVQISYNNQIVLIKKVGDHNEYMKWQLN